jgi:hypothetical protein
MTKKPRVQTEADRDALARRLCEARRGAITAIALLKQALEPETLQGEVMEETASEQVMRADAAILAVIAQLARIVDPDALTQEQAQATVERLCEPGLFAGDTLLQEWEESGVCGTRGLLVALRQLVSALQLYQDRDDRCCCVEVVDEEQCLYCTTVEALELGERWLGMLDLQRKPEHLPQNEIAWERLWYFADADVVNLVAEVQRDACTYGSFINGDLGAQEQHATLAGTQGALHMHVKQVLAPYAFRIERIGLTGEVSSFLQALAAYWIMRGHQQGRGGTSELGQHVHLQVHHRAAPDLDWGTTQPALELSTLLPHLLLSITADSAFGDLSWSVDGVRYRLTRQDATNRVVSPLVVGNQPG